MKKIKFKLPIIIGVLLLALFLVTVSSLFFKSKNNIANENEVPYISTYYIKPVVSPSENVILDFYITDFNHNSYIKEDKSSKFTVTIKMEGKKDITLKNIKAGDNSVNLGKFNNLGEQKFSILCTDEYGRNSHELFNYFLVKDDFTYNEYKVTEEDLKQYNISNNSDKENSKNTRIGLQNLLDDKKSQGFNKLTLLPGTYIIDHTGTIYIPTEFTLDLNQSTIKLNGFTGDSAVMIEMNNTFDSHVINGTIQGDYYEHDYKNSPNNSEWVVGVKIGGESKYSSFEDLVIKDITGYGATNGISNSPDEKLGYTYYSPIGIGDTFKQGDIDRKTGESIESKSRTTSDFVDIGDHNQVGYLSVSRYLGYQGNPCSTWNLIVHFYDDNKEFIKSTDGYQYRRIEVPKDAKYIKVTILSDDSPTDLSVQYFRIPTHCSFKNITFENCRAVGLAPAAMKDMLIENCEFVNCGQTSAKCALDAEDGWDMMQDVTFRGLNFHDNPNNEFLTCAGHNFIIEDMVDGKIYLWDRTNSFVIKDSNNLDSVVLRVSDRKTSGYSRFYNNTVNSSLSVAINENNKDWLVALKDSTINGKAEGPTNFTSFIRCKINDSSLGYGKYIYCSFSNISGENFGGFYYGCNFNNVSGNMHNTFEIYDSSITNWNCNAGSYEPTYIIKNSTLENFKINFIYWHQGADVLIEDCDIQNKDTLLSLPHYAMKNPINLINNKISSDTSDGLVNYYDDRTGGSAGELVKQDTLTLKNNTLTLPNSEYIIFGLDENTQNNINIDFYDNITNPESIILCNPNTHNSPNISISKDK